MLVPRFSAEQRVKAPVRHGEPGTVVEIALIEPKTSVRLQVDQVVEDLLDMPGFAIGGKSHHLVLARIHAESRICRERRIEQAE